VVTLHPIILAYTPPPREFASGKGPLERFMAWMMLVTVCWLFWLYGHFPAATWFTLPRIGGVGLLGTFFGVACGLLIRSSADISSPISSGSDLRAIDGLGVFFNPLYVVIEGLIGSPSRGGARSCS
jgi:hypothetical protein